MLSTPVVLIAFNRPHLARRTLAAIREAAPAQVFLVADGPRADRPDDAALCAETRAVFDEIDWPCEVQRRFSDVNLGVEGNVELGLDWVFAQVPEALVFEDDCTPDPTFFRFAEELLDRYRDDRRVWQISGNRHGVPAQALQGRQLRVQQLGERLGLGHLGRPVAAAPGGLPARPRAALGDRRRGRADPHRARRARPGHPRHPRRPAALRRGRSVVRRGHPRLGQALVAHDHVGGRPARSPRRATWSSTAASVRTRPTATRRAARTTRRSRWSSPCATPRRWLSTSTSSASWSSISTGSVDRQPGSLAS